MAHFFYTPMHEVTPKLVTMAVRTVMTMFRILLQSCLFSMMFLFLSECFVFQAIVIQSEAKDLGSILYVIEILPPYGRLNDKNDKRFEF